MVKFLVLTFSKISIALIIPLSSIIREWTKLNETLLPVLQTSSPLLRHLKETLLAICGVPENLLNFLKIIEPIKPFPKQLEIIE